MALTIKTVTIDGTEYGVLKDKKPLYIADDGAELALDGEQMHSKITALNAESKAHRLKAKELQEQLEIGRAHV